MKNINGIASGFTAFARGRDKAGPGEKIVSYLYRSLLLLPKAVSQLAKTVLSLPTHIRNFISAGAFAGANGVLFEGLTNPKLLKDAFVDGLDISNLLTSNCSPLPALSPIFEVVPAPEGVALTKCGFAVKNSFVKFWIVK